uniref:Uncharacterized protein n=1 Tax=Knipowitschia caucasica TaxID=637954 RepID=A0AAV2J1Z9_KNICA
MSHEDLCCPVCQDLFVDPLVLSCSHSVCRPCVESWWRGKNQRQCPVCKTCAPATPTSNLVLRNLCEATLTLFCLEHQDPVCLVCRDSERHVGHHFRPLDEAATQHRQKLMDLTRPLRDKMDKIQKIQVEYERTLEHVSAQAHRSEQQIRCEFEALHRFLREQEERDVHALREELREKSTRITERVQLVQQQSAPLRGALLHVDEQRRADDVIFLQEYKHTVRRVQGCPLLEEPPALTNALINEARHVGNLWYRVWSRMAELVEFCPVLFDPNTVDPQLSLSADLSAVTRADQKEAGPKDQERPPQNPERFHNYFAVLGSEGFTSGTAEWEVDVSGSSQWRLGVLAHGLPLEQSQWVIWFFNGVLAAQAPGVPLSMLREVRPPARVCISLDCDQGSIRFRDPGGREIHQLSFTPGLTMFPFVKTWDTARITTGQVRGVIAFEKKPEEKPERKSKTSLEKMLQKVASRKKGETTAEESS